MRSLAVRFAAVAVLAVAFGAHRAGAQVVTIDPGMTEALMAATDKFRVTRIS